MKEFWKSVRNNGYFLYLTLRTTPQYLLTAGLLRVVGGVRSVFLSVYFLSYIVSCVEQKRSIREILCFTAVSFLIVAVSFWAEAVFNCKKVPVYQEKLTGVLQHKVFEKTRSLDIRVYDSEEFYTMITLVNEECKDRMVSVLENTLRLLEYAAVFVSIIGYSLTIDVIAPVIGCLSLAVNYAINQKLVQLQVAYDRKLKEKGKEENAYERILFLPEYAREGRLTGIRDVVMRRYHTLMKSRELLIRQSGGEIGRLSAWKRIFCEAVCMDFLVPFYLTIRILVLKNIAAADFLAIINGSASLQMRLGDLSDEIAVFRQNGLFIERFRRFEQLPQETEKNLEKKWNKIPFRELEMKQVCFGYSPEKQVLQNIDLCIHKGEKVAVIGRNGSGKTTLIKLLLRLYEPDAGEMKYNGRTVQEIAVDEYRNCFSAMFQDFSIYEASVAENVAMSRQPDKKRVRDALEKVELLQELSDLDQKIGQEFGENGKLLSGGQLQRLVLARTIYADREILVMDEPTSAIDVLFEKRFYELVHKYLKDKTIIFVSHRLTSVVPCDQIFYMEDGRITENGKHNELMELNGGYAKLFLAQNAI